jgi:signal transduction histidine kinase
MFHDQYLITDCRIKREVDYLISSCDRFKGVKPILFDPVRKGQNTEKLSRMVESEVCDNDMLLVCEKSFPGLILPAGYSGFSGEHRVEHLSDLFAEKDVLKEHLEAGAFITMPRSWDRWQEDMGDAMHDDPDDPDPGILNCKYSYILVIDTGLYPDINERVRGFSDYTGLPFMILASGLGYFSLAMENIFLQNDIQKKKDQLKRFNRKTASYAMSVDFIASLVDITTEQEAIGSTCNLFRTIFAPRNVVYHSLRREDAGAEYPGSKSNAYFNSTYLLFPHGDGFAVKVAFEDEVFGIIEVHDLCFPENVDEYLSMALDLAKASGLVIASIRRYHELLSSREEQVKLTEMLRIANRILRHDIANDLNIILGAMEMFEDSGDSRFLDMSRKAALKCVALIRDMRDLEPTVSHNAPLEICSVRSIIENIIPNHKADFNVKGDCLVMADMAFSSVINNIVGNALVHGHATNIDIDITRKEDGNCGIIIADNGTGIPDSIKPRIFDEGYKYGKTGHTGIGLYITKKTIERYGGTISVEDNVPSGAKFLITLRNADTSRT